MSIRGKLQLIDTLCWRVPPPCLRQDDRGPEHRPHANPPAHWLLPRSPLVKRNEFSVKTLVDRLIHNCSESLCGWYLAVDALIDWRLQWEGTGSQTKGRTAWCCREDPVKDLLPLAHQAAPQEHKQHLQLTACLFLE